MSKMVERHDQVVDTVSRRRSHGVRVRLMRLLVMVAVVLGLVVVPVSSASAAKVYVYADVYGPYCPAAGTHGSVWPDSKTTPWATFVGMGGVYNSAFVYRVQLDSAVASSQPVAFLRACRVNVYNYIYSTASTSTGRLYVSQAGRHVAI